MTNSGVSVFVAVIEAGSFTAAAGRLGHSVSFISKAVTRLEDRIGVRLLNRTTRALSLTDAGRLYFERCQQIVADAEAAELCITTGLEEGHRADLLEKCSARRPGRGAS